MTRTYKDYMNDLKKIYPDFSLKEIESIVLELQKGLNKTLKYENGDIRFRHTIPNIYVNKKLYLDEIKKNIIDVDETKSGESLADLLKKLSKKYPAVK